MALRSSVAVCLVVFFALSSANISTLREARGQYADEGTKTQEQATDAAPKATTCSDRDITIGGMSCLQAKTAGYCERNTNLGNIGRDLCPKSCGKCPPAPKVAPRATSAAPKKITAAAKATTAAPKKTSAAPKATTAVPKKTTVALKVTIAAPKKTVAAPKATTAAPRRTTAAPKRITTAPTTSLATLQRITATKKKTTVALKVTTAAPKKITTTAIITTVAPKKWPWPFASKDAKAAPKTAIAIITTAAPKKSGATFKAATTAPKTTTLAPKVTTAARRVTTAAAKRSTAAPTRTTAVFKTTTAELQVSAAAVTKRTSAELQVRGPGTDDGNAHERNSDTNSAPVQDRQHKKAAKSVAVPDDASAGTPSLSAVKGAAADAVASAGSAAASAGSAITAFLGGGPVTTLPPGPPGPSTSTVYMSFEQRLEALVKDADGPVGPLQTLSVSKNGMHWTREQGVPGIVVNTLKTWVASREMPMSEREPILFFGGLSVVTLFCFFPMCRCPGLVRRVAMELNTWANHGNREELH